MPIYEYQCKKGHEFVVEQSMKAAPVRKCPECKSTCKRLISATSFILKGSGWAKDGYGSGVTGKNKRTPKRS